MGESRRGWLAVFKCCLVIMAAALRVFPSGTYFLRPSCTRRQLPWVASTIETGKATRTKENVAEGRRRLAEFQAAIGITVKLWAIFREILGSQAVWRHMLGSCPLNSFPTGKWTAVRSCQGYLESFTHTESYCKEEGRFSSEATM